MKRVAIYHNNTDRSAFALNQPETDAEKVVARLREAGAEYEFHTFEVTEGQFPEDPTSFDAVILTGSPAFIEDNDGWIARELDHVRQLDAARVPLVGLCFGHQAIVAALGGRVHKVETWIFGATEFDITETRPWMTPAKDHMRLYAANLAQAQTLPEGFDLLGGSSRCPIALAAKGDHIFTTQFHPEMDDRFIADLVEEYAAEMGAEVEAEARVSIRHPAEGAQYMGWVRRFIEMERG
jgi:GMP synthase-like glutamine amidotransferase